MDGKSNRVDPLTEKRRGRRLGKYGVEICGQNGKYKSETRQRQMLNVKNTVFIEVALHKIS